VGTANSGQYCHLPMLTVSLFLEFLYQVIQNITTAFFSPGIIVQHPVMAVVEHSWFIDMREIKIVLRSEFRVEECVTAIAPLCLGTFVPLVFFLFLAGWIMRVCSSGYSGLKSAEPERKSRILSLHWYLYSSKKKKKKKSLFPTFTYTLGVQFILALR